MTAPRHLTILTGASRGMGMAMARQLLQDGHRVLAISRSTSDELAAGAVQLPAGTLTQWQQDLADAPAAAARLGAWLAEQDGSAYDSATLVNNAGVLAAIRPLRDSDAASLANALRVGLEAPMLLAAAFLHGTAAWRGQRRVLNISSGLGRRAMASQAAYCAAKAGMDHFSRCVALDEAGQPNGARIVSLAPGVIDTGMQVQLRGAHAADFPDRASFEGLHANGQLTGADEAARRVLAYLARPDFGAEPVADVRG